jgi:rod shape-determining protein MreC
MALRPLTPIDSDKRRVFLGIVLLAGLLSLLDARGALGVLTSARQGLVLLTNPFTSITYGISRPVSDFFGDWSQVGSKNEIISELRAENAELIAQIQSGPDALRKSAEIDQLLQTAGLGQFKIVVARVVSIGSSSGFGSTVLIDAGKIDGIEPNMTVMAGSGMVGRVMSVTQSTALVVLMNDSTSTIGARVAENGKIGFLTGQGHRSDLILEFVDPTASVEVGHRLLSYGVAGGIFASGIPLGIVEEVNYEGGNSVVRARVRPFVDLLNLDFVGVVISKPRIDPRDALLPTPTVAPTVTVTVTATPDDQATLSANPGQSTLSATPNSSAVRE